MVKLLRMRTGAYLANSPSNQSSIVAENAVIVTAHTPGSSVNWCYAAAPLAK